MKVSYIRKKREELCLKQTDLANAIGVDKTTMSKVEKYERKLSREKALKLCEVLKIDYKDYLRAITNKEFYTVRYEKVD